MWTVHQLYFVTGRNSKLMPGSITECRHGIAVIVDSASSFLKLYIPAVFRFNFRQSQSSHHTTIGLLVNAYIITSKQ